MIGKCCSKHASTIAVLLVFRSGSLAPILTIRSILCSRSIRSLIEVVGALPATFDFFGRAAFRCNARITNTTQRTCQCAPQREFTESKRVNGTRRETSKVRRSVSAHRGTNTVPIGAVVVAARVKLVLINIWLSGVPHRKPNTIIDLDDRKPHETIPICLYVVLALSSDRPSGDHQVLGSLRDRHMAFEIVIPHRQRLPCCARLDQKKQNNEEAHLI